VRHGRDPRVKEPDVTQRVNKEGEKSMQVQRNGHPETATHKESLSFFMDFFR
jgi:hypothetical protein